MPRWAKGESVFVVRVNTSLPERGAQTTIPKPAYDQLGNPREVRFKITEGGRVVKIDAPQGSAKSAARKKERLTA